MKARFGNRAARFEAYRAALPELTAAVVGVGEHVGKCARLAVRAGVPFGLFEADVHDAFPHEYTMTEGEARRAFADAVREAGRAVR